MPQPIPLPALGEAVTEAFIVDWLVPLGGDVEVGTQLGYRGVGLGRPGEQEEQRSDARRDLSGERAEPAQHPARVGLAGLHRV